MQRNRRPDRESEASTGIVQSPMQRCCRLEIPRKSYISHDPYRLGYIAQSLKPLGNFEIIYDWATAGGNGMKPGHHIYRLLRRGGIPSLDTLYLVWSLQRDDTKMWPNGEPFAPNASNCQFIIEKIKRMLSTRDEGTGNEEANDSKQAEHKSKIKEAEKHLATEFQTYGSAGKGKNRNNLAKRLTRQQKRRAERTAVVSVSQ